MNGHCHTISPWQEIATCLVEGKCGSQKAGGCSAAQRLFEKIGKFVPVETHFCQVVGKSVSCFRCLSLITIRQCQQAEICKSPFWQALKMVAKEGDAIFQYQAKTMTFTIIGNGRSDTKTYESKVPVPFNLAKLAAVPSLPTNCSVTKLSAQPATSQPHQENYGYVCDNCGRYKLARKPWLIEAGKGICRDCAEHKSLSGYKGRWVRKLEPII